MGATTGPRLGVGRALGPADGPRLGAGVRTAGLLGAETRDGGAGIFGADIFGAGIFGAGIFGAGIFGAGIFGALFGAGIFGALFGASILGGWFPPRGPGWAKDSVDVSRNAANVRAVILMVNEVFMCFSYK